MGRLTKVTGEFMGVRFEVKPTPIRFDKIVEERRQMLLSWYKEHYNELYKKLENEDMKAEDYTLDDLENLNAWRFDVDFRSKYCKFTSDHCMKLSKSIDSKTWESDDLELGTLEEAWDFFTSRRQVPTNGLGQL